MSPSPIFIVRRAVPESIDEETGGPPPTFGASLPARMPRSNGTVIPVTSFSGLASALSSCNPMDIIKFTQSANNGGSQFNITRSVPRTTPITITSDPGVLLTNVGQPAGSNFISCVGSASGIIFEGLNVGYGGLAGIRVDDASNHIEINNCDIHDSVQQGILVYCTTYPNDIQVWNTTIHDCGQTSVQLDHGMYWGTAGAGCVVANCLFYRNASWNMQIYPSIAGMILTCNTTDDNKPSSNAWGGMVLGSESAGPTHDVICVGHIHTNAYSGGHGFGIWPYNAGPNNQIYDALAFGNATDYSSGSGVTYTNCTHADPLYVNRAGRNYHLAAGSPAKGKIQAARYGYVPALDKDGLARVTADAGCYRS